MQGYLKHEDLVLTHGLDSYLLSLHDSRELERHSAWRGVLYPKVACYQICVGGCNCQSLLLVCFWIIGDVQVAPATG